MNKQKQNQKHAKRVHVKTAHQEVQALETAVINPTHSLQRAYTNPHTLTSNDTRILQRTFGNQALRRLVIQRKMTLGPVGDKYEEEADAVAKQVVGKLHTSQAQSAAPQTTQRQEEEEEVQMKPMPTISSLQRQEEEEEVQLKPLAQHQEEEELQMKPYIQRQEEEELLQGKREAVQRQEEEEMQAKQDPMLAGGELSGNIEGAVQSAKSGGQQLDDTTRQPMEQAFGADFSSVKVHTGSQADSLNRSLSARAFTSGQDVFFRQGEYPPTSSGGQELLAHELTHVVQQTKTDLSRKPIQNINQTLTQIQRKNGAYPQNFQTTALSGSNKTGEIDHDFTWTSSSDSLDELDDILTREKVDFDQAPGNFMPAYDVLASQDGRVDLNGTTLLKTGSFGNSGRGHDTHHPGYGPFFDDETGFVKAEGKMTATQVYQYRDPLTNIWHDFPNSQFTIEREINKKGLFKKWQKWYLKTKKSGQGSSATAKTRLYDSQNAYATRKK